LTKPCLEKGETVAHVSRMTGKGKAYGSLAANQGARDVKKRKLDPPNLKKAKENKSQKKTDIAEACSWPGSISCKMRRLKLAGTEWDSGRWTQKHFPKMGGDKRT